MCVAYLNGRHRVIYRARQHHADRPTVLDVRCDPDVPPIPPHTSLDEMKATAEAVIKGDEDRWGFAKQGIKQKIQEYLPGNKK